MTVKHKLTWQNRMPIGRPNSEPYKSAVLECGEFVLHVRWSEFWEQVTCEACLARRMVIED